MMPSSADHPTKVLLDLSMVSLEWVGGSLLPVLTDRFLSDYESKTTINADACKLHLKVGAK